jgi:hypothetical protein
MPRAGLEPTIPLTKRPRPTPKTTRLLGPASSVQTVTNPTWQCLHKRSSNQNCACARICNWPHAYCVPHPSNPSWYTGNHSKIMWRLQLWRSIYKAQFPHHPSLHLSFITDTALRFIRWRVTWTARRPTAVKVCKWVNRSSYHRCDMFSWR